jgi:antitoxin (DNA-binding transcriptional repressor) of toxin-antitoxin stability system
MSTTIETTYDPKRTKSLGLKSFRENTESVIADINNGANFLVTRKSKALFRIVPVEEEAWETLVDFRDYPNGGILAEDLLAQMDKFKLENPTHGR